MFQYRRDFLFSFSEGESEKDAMPYGIFFRDTYSEDYGLFLVKKGNLHLLISRVIFFAFLFLSVIYTVKKEGIHVVAASTCLGIFDPKARIH